MKRAKSSISLKNLAMSIKQSIENQCQRTAKRSFIPLRTARSTINLHLKDLEKNEHATQLKMQEAKEHRIFILEKQIVYL